MEVFQTAQRLDPQCSGALLGIGNVLYRLGDPIGAIQTYQCVLPVVCGRGEVGGAVLV